MPYMDGMGLDLVGLVSAIRFRSQLGCSMDSKGVEIAQTNQIPGSMPNHFGRGHVGSRVPATCNFLFQFKRMKHL